MFLFLDLRISICVTEQCKTLDLARTVGWSDVIGCFPFLFQVVLFVSMPMAFSAAFTFTRIGGIIVCVIVFLFADFKPCDRAMQNDGHREQCKTLDIDTLSNGVSFLTLSYFRTFIPSLFFCVAVHEIF